MFWLCRCFISTYFRHLYMRMSMTISMILSMNLPLMFSLMFSLDFFIRLFHWTFSLDFFIGFYKCVSTKILRKATSVDSIQLFRRHQACTIDSKQNIAAFKISSLKSQSWSIGWSKTIGLTSAVYKGRHQKKNCRFGENFIIYLTPSPLLKEWKTKEWNICMFETPLPLS